MAVILSDPKNDNLSLEDLEVAITVLTQEIGARRGLYESARQQLIVGFTPDSQNRDTVYLNEMLRDLEADVIRLRERIGVLEQRLRTERAESEQTKKIIEQAVQEAKLAQQQVERNAADARGRREVNRELGNRGLPPFRGGMPRA